MLKLQPYVHVFVFFHDLRCLRWAPPASEVRVLVLDYDVPLVQKTNIPSISLVVFLAHTHPKYGLTRNVIVEELVPTDFDTLNSGGFPSIMLVLTSVNRATINVLVSDITKRVPTIVLQLLGPFDIFTSSNEPR